MIALYFKGVKKMNPDKDVTMVDRVTEIYVAVFPVWVNKERMTEVILAGYKKDPDLPGMSQVRATVETHGEAVPDLIQLCDEIVHDQEGIESYRLLKFDKFGIHTLRPDDFRKSETRYENVQWGVC